MQVEMIQVNSSNVAAVGYDYENQIVHVRFLNNTEYIYKGVPQHEFEALRDAPSVGRYFNSNYRDFYPCEKISG